MPVVASKKRSLAISKGHHSCTRADSIRFDSIFYGDICSKAEIIDSKLRTKHFYTVKFRADAVYFFFFPVDNNAAGTLVTGKHDQLHASQTLTRQFFVLYIRMDTRYVPPRFYRRISRQFFFFLLSSASLFVSPRCKQIRKLRTRELHLPLVSPIFDHKFGQRICWALNRKFNFHVEMELPSV